MFGVFSVRASQGGGARTGRPPFKRRQRGERAINARSALSPACRSPRPSGSSASARPRWTSTRWSPRSATIVRRLTLFVGRVRDHDHGKGVVGLDYPRTRRPSTAARGLRAGRRCLRRARRGGGRTGSAPSHRRHRGRGRRRPRHTGARRSTPPGCSSTPSRPRCRSGSTSGSATAPRSGWALPDLSLTAGVSSRARTVEDMADEPEEPDRTRSRARRSSSSSPPGCRRRAARACPTSTSSSGSSSR